MEKLVSETYPLLQLLPLPRCVVLPSSRTSPRLLPPGSGTRTISSRSKAVRRACRPSSPCIALHRIRQAGSKKFGSILQSKRCRTAWICLLRRATSRLSFSLILPLPACLSVHVLSALFKSSPACSLLLYPAAARWSRLPQHLRLPFFFPSPCCRWRRRRRRMEERAGEPSEVEEQGCAARPAKSRFGDVGPPPSS